MIRPQLRHVDGQSPVEGLFRGEPIAHVAKHAGEVVAVARDIGVLAAEGLLVERQGTLECRGGRVEIAQIVEDEADVIDVGGGFGVLGAEGLRVQRQCSMQQRLGVLEVAQFMREAAESADVVGEVRMVGAEFALPGLDGLFQFGPLGAEVGKVGHGGFPGWRCLDM